MTSEKVSVNINDEILSGIDLLVEDGFYANRSDFINRAVEAQIEKERKNIEKLLEIHSKEKAVEQLNEHQWFVGIQTIGREYLEQVKEQGMHLRIKGFGVLYFEKDADDALIFDTVAYISGKIRIMANDAVKEHFRAVQEENRGRGNRA
ncbi:MAG: hypothetical protein CW338_04915 [Clostridiales bacterium]|jgi:Predicted transcriptional regulators containing the CopG/Arc/MetJ DNA-binding domain|nr:hypothetical protein [Clostridiales bacterium]